MLAVLAPATALAGIVVNDNGNWPAAPLFQTFPLTAANVTSERDVRFTRNLAQTFQLVEATRLDRLFISYEEGLAGKEFTLRIFTVADVHAATLVQPGDAAFTGQVLVNLTHTTTADINASDAGNNPLGVVEITLTDADAVTLPASAGAEGYAFQLVRTGFGSDADVADQRAFKWHFNDNGNLYADGRAHALVGGGLDANDEFAFAIGGPDAEAPAVAGISAATALNRLTVVFSESVDAATAAALANYSVAPSLTLSDPQMINSRTVRFTTSAQTPGGDYTLTVNGVRDRSPAGNVIVANTQVPFRAQSMESGFVTAEFYRNILPRGRTVNDLLAWAPYQSRTADEVRYLPTVSTPPNYAEDFGVAVYGVLVPKVSGQYHFFVRSDDASALYLNTTGPGIPDPAVDFAIAEELDENDPFMEPDTFDSATTPDPFQLEAGEKYGFLFLLKGAAGNDFGQVAWRRVGDTAPAASLTPISGEFFETFVDTTGNTLEIAAHPANADAVEGRAATFNVTVTSSEAAADIGYQWMRNGVDIPGATSATYVLYPVPGDDNGANFSVRVRVPGVVRTSNAATLTVTQDETAPMVVSARAGSDRRSVDIVFDEALDPATVTALANYTVDPALELLEAQMINQTTLRLITAEQVIGTTYTVTFNGLRDWAGNALAAGTQVTFRGLGPLVQGVNGYVIWEAENTDRVVGTSWRENTTAGQPSGGASMENPQGVGAGEFNQHLEYDVLFTQTGRHYIWVRAGAERGDPGAADSVWLHVYPAGTQPARPAGRTAGNQAGLTGFSAGDPNGAFVWARNAVEGPSPMYFDIPEPGVYTIGIGIREDGSFVDKFVVTTNPNYTPTLQGPAVTIRQGETEPPASTVAIATHPANRTVFENTSAAFTVAATTTDPLISYQWQRRVGDTWQNILDATGATFTVNPATAEWNGAALRAIVSVTGASATSNEAILTVVRDDTAPTVVAAYGRADRNLAAYALTIVFSETLDQATALNVANYASPNLPLSDPVMVTDRAIRFSTAEQVIGGEYVITINGVRDLAQNPIAPNTQVRIYGNGPLQQHEQGFVVWEAEEYDRKLGSLWREENTAFTPSGGLAMAMPDNVSDTEFGDHLEYDIQFTRAGLHTIYVRGRANDGNADSVWLHVYPAGAQAVRPSNRTASNDAGLAGFNTGAAGNFVWGSDAVSGSDPMTFEIPEPGLYTIGIGSREDGAFIDKFFIRPPGSTMIPSGFGPTETARLGDPAPVNTITSQPVSQTVFENRPASFTVGVQSNDPFPVIQWQQRVNGIFQDIAGATAATYSIASATTDISGSVFRARIGSATSPLYSQEATLTVNDDTAAPTVASAGAYSGGASVGLRFDELLDPAAIGTYTVNGVAVDNVTLYFDRYVRLILPQPLPAQAGNTVTVTGARDLAGNASAAATYPIQIVNMSSQDLGSEIDPIEIGDAFTWGTGHYVTGGGSDIWGQADHGHFVYQQFTGAFDMRARIDHMRGGDEWNKATLMARESLEANSRNTVVLATKPAPYVPPTTGGMNVYNMQWRDTTGGDSASTPTAQRISPTVFPSWIRLVRESVESNKIDSYVSFDGETWVPLDTHTTPGEILPATLYLGMAVTSHDNAPGFPRAEDVYENFTILPLGGGGPFDPNLAIAREGGNLVIRWDTGTLVSSPTVDGDYAPVTGATSPHTVQAEGTARFFQVTRP